MTIYNFIHVRILGNIIWLIFGGFMIAVEYVLASLVLMVTIVGIPFGLQTLKFASLALWPFGRDAVYREKTSGCVSTLMNIIWILCGGIWIAATHLLFALLLAITIIGIPFAGHHVKLASVAIAPFGRNIEPI